MEWYQLHRWPSDMGVDYAPDDGIGQPTPLKGLRAMSYGGFKPPA